MKFTLNSENIENVISLSRNFLVFKHSFCPSVAITVHWRIQGDRPPIVW
jgi:hypothetical protein